MRNTYLRLFQSTLTFTFKTPKPNFKVEYFKNEIERKCQWKLDRKSCMGKMVKIFCDLSVTIWSNIVLGMTVNCSQFEFCYYYYFVILFSVL